MALYLIWGSLNILDARDKDTNYVLHQQIFNINLFQRSNNVCCQNVDVRLGLRKKTFKILAGAVTGTSFLRHPTTPARALLNHASTKGVSWHRKAAATPPNPISRSQLSSCFLFLSLFLLSQKKEDGLIRHGTLPVPATPIPARPALLPPAPVRRPPLRSNRQHAQRET